MACGVPHAPAAATHSVAAWSSALPGDESRIWMGALSRRQSRCQRRSELVARQRCRMVVPLTALASMPPFVASLYSLHDTLGICVHLVALPKGCYSERKKLRNDKTPNTSPGTERLTKEQLAVSAVLGRLLAEEYIRQQTQKGSSPELRRDSRE